MRRTAPPEWLLAFWKEIDDKTFGKGFDSFTEDATCNWHRGLAWTRANSRGSPRKSLDSCATRIRMSRDIGPE
jgi:hypothetical protein